MNDSKKLDVILELFQSHEVVSEEKRLIDLAQKHWGLKDSDCEVLFLAKKILDTGKANNSGETLGFVIHFGSAVKEYGADSMIKALDNYKKEIGYE
ncbi:hypothetical protein BSK66_26595 [Paenibacillus odorifer]|uniref:hypothetical protein n=1 Tax=Paenibacillus TaxID=44249 RepID=UPI0003E26045|nr:MULTISPECIES: hypothetical protein [Paenibacillus]ETT49317.1 hypothetical protein C171_23630 [Paenibacillus sp. FSL H8-237]OME49529.1 hypothetical protein BSK66_26595 [Paenibacillus odorifer]